MSDSNDISDVTKLIYSDDNSFDYSGCTGEMLKCAMCHKPFYKVGKRASSKYCKRDHYINCAICGKPVKLKELSTNPSMIPRTCSKECANHYKAIQTKRAVKAKYGVENILDVPEYRDKAANSIRDKSAETAAKVKATMTERYGGYPMQSPKLREKIFATNIEKYGSANPSKIPK